MFRAEFRGRVDEVVAFTPLDGTQLRAIARLLIAETATRLGTQGITLEVTEAAVGRLTELGTQPELGARPLRRTLAKELDRRVSRMIITGELQPGTTALVDVTDGALTITAKGTNLRK